MDINETMKKIMGYKEKLGEFSLDLYYDDCGGDTPCVAKLHGPFQLAWDFEHHERAESFETAIERTDGFMQGIMEKGMIFMNHELIGTGTTYNLPRFNNTTTITEI